MTISISISLYCSKLCVSKDYHVTNRIDIVRRLSQGFPRLEYGIKNS